MATLLNTPIKRIVVIALIALSSCKDSDKNSSLIFEELNESLERSIYRIDISTSTIHKAFDDRLKKPVSAERAREFEPKLNFIRGSADGLYEYINDFKSKLVNIKNDNTESTLIDQSKASDSLYSRMNSFEQAVLNVDSPLQKQFDGKIFSVSKTFSFSDKRKDDFFKTYFENKRSIEVYSFLTKLQCNIRVIENELLLFLYHRSTVNDDSYSVEIPFILQNSTCFRPGQELEVKATIGEIRNSLDFTLSIDGELVPNNLNTSVRYSKKVPNEPGKYKSVARFEYTTKYGRKEVENKIIEYEVIK